MVGVATRLDPFREFDRFVDQALNSARSAAVMPVDAFRAGDHFVIQTDLPGVDPGSIDVSVEEATLTIRAERTPSASQDVTWLTRERGSGTYVRQILLGQGVAHDKIQADYNDGVLTLTLPMAEAAKPRRIQINYGVPQEISQATGEDESAETRRAVNA